MNPFFRHAVLIPLASIIGLGFSENAGRLSDDKRDKEPGVKKIPLNSIHSTSGQGGLKLLDRGTGDDGFREQMAELYQQSTRMGASNIFLVRGDNIAAAVRATWRVFEAAQPVDKPVVADHKSEADSYWLVVFLGVAWSEPPAWLIDSVTVEKKSINVIVKKNYPEKGSRKVIFITADSHPYFAWIPLGTLPEGSYAVGFGYQRDKEMTLTRRVQVKKR